MLNNVEQYDQLNNDDNNINGMGELNTEALSTIDNEYPGKLNADDLLADSVKNTRNTNETFDWEESYESHFCPYKGLYSDPGFDFE